MIYFAFIFAWLLSALDAVRCPPGSTQIGGRGADIAGCGIEGCNARYRDRYQNIIDCQNACNAVADCKSFSWAPRGGDQNHRSDTVCTLYKTDVSDQTWGTKQVLCKPIDKLVCPAGTQQVGGINSDISGCGIEACEARYKYTTIEQCRDACDSQKKPRCKSFTWAPLNGDKNHPGKSVCTLYTKARPTSKWGTSQIMCKPLQCVGGAREMIGDLNSDIAGCGLTSCDARYKIPTVSKCAKECNKRVDCVSYSFAPPGGDKNHMGQTVCTLYNTDQKNQDWGPNQVLCKSECDSYPNRPAIVSGDPHYIMWNGQKHHFQGDFDAPGQIFYLVTNCDINDKTEMPFSMLASLWAPSNSRSGITGLDYIIIVLYEDNGDEFYVFFSPQIREYVKKASGVTTDYDANKANAVSMTPYSGDTDIGTSGRFSIEVTTNKMTIVIKNKNKKGRPCEISMIMGRGGWFRDGRSRMNYLKINPPECYKCNICGLLGDFQTPRKEKSLIGCDGKRVQLGEGSKWRPGEIAFRSSAYTWQQDYVLANCVAPEKPGNAGDLTCSQAIKPSVIDKCQTARDAQITCCRNIGGEFCNSLQTDCEIDVCIQANGDASLIDGLIKTLFTDEVEKECLEKGAFGPVPTLLYEFQGNLDETMSGGDPKYRLGLGRLPRVPIFRYYHGHHVNHFYTSNSVEIGTTTPGVIGKHGYVSEGIGFYLIESNDNGAAVPLYRYYHGIVNHFYTTNANEIGTTTPGQVGKHGYVSEGIVGYCYPTQVAETVPLYRYYHGSRINHFYTTNINEIGTATPGAVGKHGYTAEGIQCYVFPDNNAYVGDGVLNCDGTNDYVFSEKNLDIGIASHSMEVLIQISDLNNAGSGTITIDSLYNINGGYQHREFDSIVYNEIGNNKKFILGSEYHERSDTDGSKSSQQPTTYNPANYKPESVTGLFIQLIATYNVETKRAKLYRNGIVQLDYDPGDFLQAQPDEGYRIMFCQRHFNADGFDNVNVRNREFNGKIRYGAIYNYALSEQDIQQLYQSKIEGNCEIMGDELFPGQILTEGQALRSTNKAYIAVMQGDGNFVVYDIRNTQWRALWATYGQLGSTAFVAFQGDGNLVVYGSSGGVRYASMKMNNNPGRLIMQNDGNLVAYDVNGVPYFASNTVQPAAMQSFLKSFDNYHINEKGNIIHTSQLWTYLTYLIAILLGVNIICYIVYCYNKQQRNNKKGRYNVVSVQSTDTETDIEN